MTISNEERNSPLGLASFFLANAVYDMTHRCYDPQQCKQQLTEALYRYGEIVGIGIEPVNTNAESKVNG